MKIGGSLSFDLILTDTWMLQEVSKWLVNGI